LLMTAAAGLSVAGFLGYYLPIYEFPHLLPSVEVTLPILGSVQVRWAENLWCLALTAVELVLLTLLMHPGSPLSLPTGVLDDSSGFRTRLYWAQLIVIAVVTPLSFVLNKLWTFAAVRTHHLEAVPAHPAAERELEHLGVDETDGP